MERVKSEAGRHSSHRTQCQSFRIANTHAYHLVEVGVSTLHRFQTPRIGALKLH